MADLYLPLARVLDTEWEFKCPRHGVQSAKPLQAHPLRSIQVRCGAQDCQSRSVGIIEGEPFCRDHYIAACDRKLGAFNNRMRERNWRELSLETISRFMQDSLRLANVIGLDKEERARLHNLISSAANLGRHLRRSPRKVVSIPVVLSSEGGANTWEENTEVVMISRCGAQVKTRHAATIDLKQRVLILRPNDMAKAAAHVVWSSRPEDENAMIAVEFEETGNFWNLDWSKVESAQEIS